MLTTDALLDLGEALRARRFPVSTHQLIAAGRLLGALTEEGRSPPEPEELGPYLSPLFCTNAEQQEQFGAAYHDWLRLRYPSGGKSAGKIQAPDRQPVRPASRWCWPPLLAWLSLLALVTGAILWETLRTRSLVVAVVSDCHLMASVDVQAGSIAFRGKTDGDGHVTIPYRAWDLPLAFETARGGFANAALPVATVPARPVVLHMDEVTPRTPLPQNPGKIPRGARRLFVIPAAPQIDVPPVRKEIREFRPWTLPVILLPLVLAALWWLFAQLRRRGWLERLPGATPQVERQLRSEGAQPLRAMSTALRALGRELRRRHSVASHTLDVAATVQATLRQGGFPQPVFRTRVEPEYVVLIDRVSLGDHQALLADEIVQSLAAQDVAIDRFYFRGDPRHVWKVRDRNGAGTADRKDITVSALQDVFGRFGDRRLMVFSDGRDFIDAYRGRESAMVDALKAWPAPILLTPQDHSAWGRREWVLSRAGLTVLPLSVVGLSVLGEMLGRRGPALSVPEEAGERVRPLYLREVNPLLDRVPPEAAFVTELLDALRRDLEPDAFAWLCACAVYPGVHWGITLRVGQCVVAEDARFAKLLPSLARLPWLRDGFFPDWFREALLARLSHEEEDRVRATLGEFLRRIADAADDPLPLRIAIPAQAVTSVWKDIARGLRRTRHPKAVLDESDRDLVFLRFMSGRSPRLGVNATDTIRKLFFVHGLPLAGVRIVPLCLISILLAGGLAWTSPPVVIQIDEMSQPPRRPLPTTLTLSNDGQLLVSGDSAGGVSAYRTGGPTSSVTAEDRAPITHVALVQGRVAVVTRAAVYSYRRTGSGSEWSKDSSPPTVKWAADKLQVSSNYLFDGAEDQPLAGDDALCVGVDPVHDVVVKVGSQYLSRMVGLDSPAASPNPPTGCAVSPGGTTLLIGRADGTLHQLSLDATDGPRRPRPQVVRLPAGAPVTGLTVSDDGTTAVAVRADGHVTVVRAPAGSVETLEGLGATGPVAMTPDGKTFVFATRTREVEAWALDTIVPRNYLISIAVNASALAAGRLRSPVPDARALADVLTRRYGYAVVAAENPTKAQIAALFDKAMNEIRPEDRVIVLFSGAGGRGVDPSNPNGIALVTGSARGTSMVTPSARLSAPEMAELVRRLPAREVLTILDTSNAGAALALKPASPAAGTVTRTLLASSAATQDSVDSAGVSAFGRALRDALATHKEPLLTGKRLSNLVELAMAVDPTSTQAPVYGPFLAAGHAGGDFLLIPTRPPLAPLVEPRVEKGPVPEARNENANQQPVGPSPAQGPVTGTTSSDSPTGRTYAAGETFRECAECPEMVVIPAGQFQMGAQDTEEGSSNSQRPVHPVSIRSFAMGKYEVTHEEWAACVTDGDCRNASDHGFGRARLPVIDVSYDGASRYVQWLSKKAKAPYRLPAEAEWEYATRAGSTGRWYWGDNKASACRYENVYDEASRRGKDWGWDSFPCNDSFPTTAPVGAFRPNPFGLYDTAGNVTEWTDDCWNDSYAGAPPDGKAWARGDCSRRVVRGGSWGSEPQSARSAVRYRYVAGDRNSLLGFRVARTLP